MTGETTLFASQNLSVVLSVEGKLIAYNGWANRSEICEHNSPLEVVDFLVAVIDKLTVKEQSYNPRKLSTNAHHGVLKKCLTYRIKTNVS